MTVRHERVVVDLDDRFSSPAARMAASAGLLRKNLDDSGRGVIAFDRTVKSTSPSIDQLSGRVALLSRAAGALGPAFLPIATAAVPALAGLSTQLGFAVAGAGTAVLAFNGIGDALEALNAYQLEPTEANLAKLQESVRGLGPAAREFVGFLDEIGPQLQSLRESAQEGLLPGVQEGLDALLGRLPQVRSIISEVAEASGDLVSGAGISLAGSGWDQFFTFLEAEARPALMALGETAGNTARGIAELWMALDPLSDDFTAGLLDASEAFAQWADGVSRTEGYREFIAYVRETGPQVVETVGSVADALLQIAEAAAPLGGPVLTGLELIADTVAVIADSPIGPPLMAAVTAMSALSLATKGWASVMETSAVGRVKGLTADLKTMGSTGVVAWGQSAAEAEKYNQAAGRVRSTLSSMGRSAGLVAGLAVASSGLGESMGVSNTASLALMGTMAGPWGAAIGGATGLVMDFAAAGDGATDALKRFNAAAGDATSLQQYADAVDQLQSDFESFRASVTGESLFGHIGESLTPGGFKNNLDVLFGGFESSKLGQLQAEAEKAQIAVSDLEFALMHFANLEGTETQAELVGKMKAGLENAKPALDALGYSMQDLIDAASEDGGAGIQRIVAEVEAFNAAADSAEGKSTAVGDALAGLQDPMMSTADAASALKSAMDSLFGVQLSQSEATDAWITGLQGLRDQIAETSGALRGNSEAALGNRAAVRDSVNALQARIEADAAAGVSGDRLAETLMRGREAIINQAAAAGASKKEVRAYLDTLGLTPDNLATIIRTPGLIDAKDQIKALQRLYGLTPKDVRTLIVQAGMDPSQAKVRELARLYNLTPKQVQTIIDAVDNATGTLNYIQGQISALDGRQARAYVTTYYNEVYNRNPIGGIQRASGGVVYGPGTATSDSIPAYLSNGEYVIKAAAVAKYGVAMFDRLNSMRFADGGFVQPRRYARGGQVEPMRPRDFRQFNLSGRLGVDGVRSDLRDFRRAIREAGGTWTRGLERMSDRSIRVARRFEQLSDRLGDARDDLRDLRDDRNAYRREVAGSFDNDFFGNGVAGLRTQLAADRNDARAMREALQRADRRGLSRGLFRELAASGDLTTAQQIASMSRGEINRLDRLYAQRASAQSALGGMASGEVYGRALNRANRTIDRLERQVRRQNRVLSNLEDRIERGAARGTAEGTARAARGANQRRKARRR